MLPAQIQNMPVKSNYENHGKLYGAGILNYSKIPTGDTISYGLDKYGNMCMIVNNKILGFYFGCILLGKYWLSSSAFHPNNSFHK